MTDIRNSQNWSFETKQVHIGQEQPDPATGARAVPIYASASFVFDDCQHAADRFALKDSGNIYGRLTNPTEDAFEQRIAALEGGTAALATASGAAAITYTFSGAGKSRRTHCCFQDDIWRILQSSALIHCRLQAGSRQTFVDPEEEGAFERAIQKNTKAIFVETLGNPNSNVADLETLAELAHKHKIPLVVDSTFATPVSGEAD